MTACAGERRLNAEHRELLRLLAVGEPDTSIARRLAVGRLGVETRFQAGMAARRLGVLGGQEPRREPCE
jgi:DNA-binding NarL/FixJ family response regulator